MSPGADGEVTMALITRADLKLSIGKACAQAGHAAVEAALRANRQNPRMLERWRTAGARKITLRTPDLDSLQRLFGEAQEAGLAAYMVRDAGHTEIPSGTVTFVGILGPRRAVDALIGDLSLY